MVQFITDGLIRKMSLYLAKKTSANKDDVSATFIAKKLKGLAPAPINQLSIFGVTQFLEVAYSLYRSNIDAFVHATVTKTKTFAQAESFSNFMNDEILLPFTRHPLCFSPRVKVNQDGANRILTKLGNGTTMKYIGQTLEYTIPEPVIASIPQYIKAAAPHYSPGPSRFTPEGFKAYIKAISLLEGFFATNYYPAYKDLVTEIPQGPGYTMGFVGENDVVQKKHFFTHASGLKRDSKGIVDHHSVLKRRNIMDEGSDKEEGAMEVDVVEEVKLADNLGAITVQDSPSAVVYAKPSGRKTNMNFGPSGSVPALPGLLFPYFDGLNRPDFCTIREVMVNCFFRLFGETFDECKEELKEIKRGINNLCNSKAGMEITHAFKGIELALKTQTRLFLIFEEDGYKGFVLLGGRFSVWNGSLWVDPVEYQELRKEMDGMNNHKKSIVEISLLLSTMSMVDKTKPPVVVSADEITSASVLMDKMSIRDFTNYSHAEEFDRCLVSLVWPSPYVVLQPDNFHTFLVNFFEEIRMPSSSTPMYLSSCKSPVGDPLFRNLATFGPDAPSLWNTRGDIISIVPSGSRKGQKERETEDVAVPKEIIILPKPLLVAYNDWKKVIKDGAVSFNLKERAKSFRGHVVTDEAVKGKIWRTLCSGVRRLNESEEPKKKKARVVGGTEMTAEELENLF